MIKALCLIGGLAGGATLAQYPEFSQQYLQRLAGQVDALTTVVVDFDRSALAAGLGREQALAQMTGTDFLQARQLDMRRTFGRHTRLSENLMLLRNASPMQRLLLPHRMGDAETLQAVWGDFAPAVPTNAPGLVAASAGFIGGWGLVGMLLGLMAVPFRRIRHRFQERKAEKVAAVVRHDPPVMRPQRPTLVLEQPSHLPRLMGETR